MVVSSVDEVEGGADVLTHCCTVYLCGLIVFHFHAMPSIINMLNDGRLVTDLYIHVSLYQQSKVLLILTTMLQRWMEYGSNFFIMVNLAAYK